MDIVEKLLTVLEELSCDVVSSRKENDVFFCKSKSRSALIKWISYLFCENPNHLNPKDELCMPAISNFWCAIGLVDKKQKLAFFCATLPKELQLVVWGKVYDMLEFYKRLKNNTGSAQNMKNTPAYGSLNEEAAFGLTEEDGPNGEELESMDNVEKQPDEMNSVRVTLEDFVKSMEKIDAIDLHIEESSLPSSFYSNLDRFYQNFALIDQFNQSVKLLTSINMKEKLHHLGYQDK